VSSNFIGSEKRYEGKEREALPEARAKRAAETKKAMEEAAAPASLP
jgi:hypothetical protein